MVLKKPPSTNGRRLLARAGSAIFRASSTIGLFAALGFFFGGTGASAAPEVRSSELEIVEMRLVLKAPDRDSLFARVRSWAESKNGYLVRLQTSSCTVDIPTALGIDVIQKEVAGFGRIVERNVARRSVAARVRDLQASMRARERHLQRLEGLFKDVGFSETLALEKELHSALKGLERAKGERNFLRARARMVRLTVTVESTPGVRTGRSIPLPAPWVGSVLLERFLARFAR